MHLKNLGTNPFADVAFTTNPLTYSNNSEWQWAYRQSALGGREQKRLLTSLHSDETANNGKIFAHLWEYSLLVVWLDPSGLAEMFLKNIIICFY